MTAPNATKVWIELERVHRTRGLATHLTLCCTFLTMKMKPDQLMSQWIADVRFLAFRLCAIGVTVKEEDMILVMTMGLPCFYNTFTIALNSTPADELTLDAVITRLLNEESRAKHNCATEVNEKPSTDTAAYVSHGQAAKCSADCLSSRTGPPNLAHITCYTCRKKGHYQINCPSKSAENSNIAVVETAGAAVAFNEEVNLVIDEGW